MIWLILKIILTILGTNAYLKFHSREQQGTVREVLGTRQQESGTPCQTTQGIYLLLNILKVSYFLVFLKSALAVSADILSACCHVAILSNLLKCWFHFVYCLLFIYQWFSLCAAFIGYTCSNRGSRRFPITSSKGISYGWCVILQKVSNTL